MFLFGASLSIEQGTRKIACRKKNLSVDFSDHQWPGNTVVFGQNNMTTMRL